MISGTIGRVVRGRLLARRWTGPSFAPQCRDWEQL